MKFVKIWGGVPGGRRTGYPRYLDPIVLKNMPRKIEYAYNHSLSDYINSSRIIRKNNCLFSKKELSK